MRGMFMRPPDRIGRESPAESAETSMLSPEVPRTPKRTKTIWLTEHRRDGRFHRIDMRIPGKRVKRTRLIHSDQYVVAVEVEMVIPVDDPSEPCYEAETVEFLREVAEHAERGDVVWLRRHGKVYEELSVA